MKTAICTDCQKERLITSTLKATAQVEANGVTRTVLVDVMLCRGCLRKRAQGLKRNR